MEYVLAMVFLRFLARLYPANGLDIEKFPAPDPPMGLDRLIPDIFELIDVSKPGLPAPFKFAFVPVFFRLLV